VYNGGGSWNAIFSMTGGVISDNMAECINTGDFGNGGGVYNAEDGYIEDDSSDDFFDKDNFVMSGGVISNNKASNGGGVYSMGNFRIVDGEISGNSVVNYGGGVYSSGGFDRWGGTISGNRAAKGNNVYFYDDTVWSSEDGDVWLSDGGFGLRGIVIVCACVVCVIGGLFLSRTHVRQFGKKIR
ncbi:MAG: hypothetical protein LBQ98_01970, partial [Nitrososphaerota archaeon]|jgi:hypothetical protein|nr:hypothetical protein [Nitrososphaerota archaeon]